MHLVLILVLLLSLTAMPLAGCRNKDNPDSIVVSGSTTVLPIAEVAASAYSSRNEGTSVLVSGMGSSAGIEAVHSGTADIGTASRELKSSEKDFDLVEIPIAYDGIAVILHRDNRINELTSDDLRDIFSGEKTNWKEFGGVDLEIELINRDEASGTREAFSKIVMRDTLFDVGAVVLPGTGQVREVVSRTPGAIGYISVGFVNSAVKAIDIDGVKATRESVANGTYPISRKLYFFTQQEQSPLVKNYIDFVLSEEVQKGAVVQAGFIPVNLEVSK